MIKIGEFAKICNVSTQTLRYYDAQGILKADVVDASSGYRLYSVDAVEKYKQILFYKNLGFSLEEIKQIQSATEEQLQGILQKKKEELSHSVEKCKDQIQLIDSLRGDSPKKPVLSEILFLPFEDHREVIGKWELCGKLLDEHILSVSKETIENSVDQHIIFMPGGAFAWKYFWTKGTLYRISSKYKFAIPNPYKILERDGIRYMVIQFMSDECIDNGKDTILLLYRQIDTAIYTEQQIRPNVDNINLPFEDDSRVHGEWRSVGFVSRISDFDPRKKLENNKETWILGIAFLMRGVCTRTIRTRTGSAKEMLRFTNGYVLNDRELTAEEYQLHRIQGKEFLFLQHKSGDYSYGGKTPSWYVFERQGK